MEIKQRTLEQPTNESKKKSKGKTENILKQAKMKKQ